MSEILRSIVLLIAKIHNYIFELFLNKFGFYDDKLLHFIILGLVGMAIVFIIHPLFSYLAKRGMTISLTFIYVFTCMIVITFAIEIGQKITNTGEMDFKDITAGIVGFLAMFIVYSLIVLIIRKIKEYFASRQSTGV